MNNEAKQQKSKEAKENAEAGKSEDNVQVDELQRAKDDLAELRDGHGGLQTLLQETENIAKELEKTQQEYNDSASSTKAEASRLSEQAAKTKAAAQKTTTEAQRLDALADANTAVADEYGEQLA